eukprot:363040-Chlamydomonas_euryale.AAC.2
MLSTSRKLMPTARTATSAVPGSSARPAASVAAIALLPVSSAPATVALPPPPPSPPPCWSASRRSPVSTPLGRGTRRYGSLACIGSAWPGSTSGSRRGRSFALPASLASAADTPQLKAPSALTARESPSRAPIAAAKRGGPSDGDGDGSAATLGRLKRSDAAPPAPWLSCWKSEMAEAAAIASAATPPPLPQLPLSWMPSSASLS